MSDIYTELEEKAGHELTMVGAMLAGITTYYCEWCGVLVQIRNGELILFHAHRWSSSTKEHCNTAFEPLAYEGHETLKSKLDKLSAEDYQRLKKI